MGAVSKKTSFRIPTSTPKGGEPHPRRTEGYKTLQLFQGEGRLVGVIFDWEWFSHASPQAWGAVRCGEASLIPGSFCVLPVLLWAPGIMFKSDKTATSIFSLPSY